MEHKEEKRVVGVSDVLSDAGNEIESILSKEQKMEGIDPGLLALLKENGVDSNNLWNNPITLLIVLGFLGRRNGLFGEGGGAEGGAAIATAAANSAKLDCLQQGQTEALMRNLADGVNGNITNLSNRVVDSFHSSEISTQKGFTDILTAFCKCCCELQAGQKDIINELCKQTGLTVAAGVANTQRIVDTIEKHADEEVRDKLMDCQRALSNSEQTKELSTLIRENCENSHGGSHGGRRGAKVD